MARGRKFSQRRDRVFTNRRTRMERVVLAVINRAIDKGHGRLAGLGSLTPLDVYGHLVPHERQHTVIVTEKHVRNGTPGHLCDCAIAQAAEELPEVYAAVVMRRVTYFLERDEAGNLKIYKYDSPDAARRFTIRFDAKLKVKRLVIGFKPLPWSRTREGLDGSIGGQGPTGRTNKRSRYALTRTVIPQEMLRARKAA